MAELSRRDVLATATAAGVAGLSGCLGYLVQGEDNSETDASGTESRGDTVTVVDTNVETVESNCLGRDNEIEVELQDTTVIITGMRTAPNPCHHVVVEATIEGRTLSVEVDVEPENEDEDCIQCVGSLEYEAHIELSSDSVETVEVNHKGADGGGSVDLG